MESQTFCRILSRYHEQKGWSLVCRPAELSTLYSRHSSKLQQEITMRTVWTMSPAQHLSNSVAQISRYYAAWWTAVWQNSIFCIPHIPIKNIGKILYRIQWLGEHQIPYFVNLSFNWGKWDISLLQFYIQLQNTRETAKKKGCISNTYFGKGLVAYWMLVTRWLYWALCAGVGQCQAFLPKSWNVVHGLVVCIDKKKVQVN
jgi:hypothetical protein